MSLDLDKILRHEVYVQRLASGGLKDSVYPSLDATLAAVKAILSEHGVVPNITELNRITKAITEEINSQKGWATLTTALDSLAVYEAGFQATVLGEAFAHKMNVPKDSSIVRYVTKSIMSLESGKRVDAGTWANFVKANVNSQTSIINQIVINAYSKGEALNTITNQIQTAFTGIIKPQAESLARTGYAHYTAQANEAMIQDNADILSDYYYVVTFDSRLSDICRNVSIRYNPKGKRFSVGDKAAPFPPLHFNAVAEGEKIKTMDGNKPIENVAVGDMVLTHKNRYKKVLTVMRKRNDSGVVRVLSFKSGRKIRVTDEHPVLVDGVGWVRADQVKVGDSLFESTNKKGPVCDGGPVIKRNPDYYPSLFDGEEVFSEVAFKSGDMASSINLDSDLMFNINEIPNGVADDVLVNKPVAKKINKGPFTFDVIGPIFNSFGFKGFSFCSRISHRVFIGHSIGVRSMNVGSFLSHTEGPMISADTDTFRGFNFSSLRRSFGPTHWFNVMNSAPSTHGPVSEVKFSLNGPKRFFKNKVVLIKKRMEKLFINKTCAVENHWNTSVVSSITIVEHNKDVYNLEVEEDNTYLVDNIVVHNCRTRRIATPKGWMPTGDKSSVGGRVGGGENYEERLERKDGRVVKYTGKNDKAFKGEVIKANTTYSTWLKNQPTWFVTATLGKTRADLFLSGKMKLSRFTDMTGRTLTLEELKVIGG